MPDPNIDDLLTNIAADKVLQEAVRLTPADHITMAVLSMALTKAHMVLFDTDPVSAATELSRHFARVASRGEENFDDTREEIDDALSRIAAKVADA